METAPINDLVSRLSAGLPSALSGLREELEAHFRQVLSSAAARLDLASRDEFEVQARLLERARAELAALEARVAALEARR